MKKRLFLITTFFLAMCTALMAEISKTRMDISGKYRNGTLYIDYHYYGGREQDIYRDIRLNWHEYEGEVFIYQGENRVATHLFDHNHQHIPNVGRLTIENLSLPAGNYTFKTSEKTFIETVEFDDLPAEENDTPNLREDEYYMGVKTFDFTVCEHTFNSNGICTKCQDFEPPVKADGIYQIKNAGNLKYYADVHDGPARLTNDIVLNTNVLNADGSLASGSHEAWTPFDTDHDFDGNNHSISGLYVNSNDDCVGGFIQNIKGDITIKNLTIKDSYIHTPGAYAAAFAGNADWHKVNFVNCMNQATVICEAWPASICAKGLNNNATVKSCINIGKLQNHSLIDGIHNISEGTLVDCVALRGCASSTDEGQADIDAPGQTFVTSAQLADGTATLLLNNIVTDGTQAWYQRIGTDALPHTVSKGGDTVYGGYKHGETVAKMSNDQSSLSNLHAKPFDSNATTEQAGGHGYSMVDGVCQVCNLHCQHPSYTNGVCNSCHYHCPHTPHQTVNGFYDYCAICNYNMTAMYEPAPQNPQDGYYEVSNAGQLFWMVSKVNADERTSFRLMKDITVNTGVLNADGNPVAEGQIAHKWQALPWFNGTFDGQGHTISGLYGASMFNDIATGAVVKNFGILDSYFTTASLAEYLSDATISNVFSQATVANADAALIVKASSSTVSACYYDGKKAMDAMVRTVDGMTFKNCVTSANAIYKEKAHNAEQASILENCETSVSQGNFASGFAAYKLNNGITDGTQAWYQAIGQDANPVLKSNGKNTVYRVKDCQKQTRYCNTNQLDEGNHLYDQETLICKFCNHGKPAPLAEDGYYEISKVGHLYWFKEKTDEDPSLNARLICDITFNKSIDKTGAGMLKWDGIGINNKEYKGKFDGQGHAIHGLYGKALFELMNGATLSHLGLADSYITSPSYGTFANYAIESTIENCYVRNTYNNGGDNILVKNLVKSNMTGCYLYNTTIDESYKTYVAEVLTRGTVSNCCVLGNSDYSVVKTNDHGEVSNSKVLTASSQFASGEATWLLNGGMTDGTQAWYQVLNQDNIPGFNKSEGSTVYHFTNCQGNGVYENCPDYNGHIGHDNGSEFVCKYCGQNLPGYLDTNDYLSFKAVGGNMVIGMRKTGSPATDYALQYSKDKSSWITVFINATVNDLISLDEGETCYFRHGTQTIREQISVNQYNYWSFTMTGDGTIVAAGNVMSLLDATCKKNTMTNQPQHVFTGLFKDCAALTTAPKLPATELAQFCYVNMFEGTSITEAPQLPAKTINDGAYWGMFRNCKNLTTVPALPGVNLYRKSYAEMFYGCEKLTAVEIANIKLNDTRDDESNASFWNWLEGTAVGTTGVLSMPDVLVGNKLIFMPSNWTAQSIDGHNYVPEKDAEGNDWWIWDGVTKATLKVVCTKNTNHKTELVATGDAITSDITTAPTCTVDGVRTYTATVSIGSTEYKSTKTAVEPMLGHNYQHGVCTRCGDMPSYFEEFTINDGDPYLLPLDRQAGTLTYNRYYNVDVWSAWYMPIEVNASYLEANGLTPAYIDGIHNYDDDKDGTIDRTVMEVIKITKGRLFAGMPYLVRAAEGYSNSLTWTNATMKACSATRTVETSTATSKFDFAGTYTGMAADDVVSQGNLYSLDGTGNMVHRNGKILPLRWYCAIAEKPSVFGEEVAPALKSKTIQIHVLGEEDQTTGIRIIYSPDRQSWENTDVIFDLEGKRLSAPQRGKVNIINGKKQFVK